LKLAGEKKIGMEITGHVRHFIAPNFFEIAAPATTTFIVHSTPPYILSSWYDFPSKFAII